MRDRGADSIRQLDEFHTGSISNFVLIDVADARMGDASLDHDGQAAERQAEVVKGIQLQWKAGLHLHAAVTHLADGRWLEDHYLAVHRSKELDALGITLVRGHSLGIIA